MRIGEVMKKTNLTRATIHYYISLGLVIPQRNNNQYNFSQHDLEMLEFVMSLKDMGFQLQEIQKFVSLKRISNWVEAEDLADYRSLLEKKRQELEDESARIQHSVGLVEDEIRNLSSLAVVNPAAQRIGVPISALDLLECPQCGQSLFLENASMDRRYIFSGRLFCGCGYEAEIKEGVLYTVNPYPISSYDKPDVNRNVYKESPSELVTLYQKAYNWIFSRLRHLETAAGKVVMETHLNSFFFLYKHAHRLNKANTYIVSDKFEQTVLMNKKNIEGMGLNLNVLFIVANGNLFPIRKNCIDILIDFNSTNEHSIFFPTFYLKDMSRYMKTEGHVFSTYFSFDRSSSSIEDLCARYPDNNRDNYTPRYYLENIMSDYTILEEERIGMTTYSGEGITFIFHQKGDNLYLDNYYLQPVR